MFGKLVIFLLGLLLSFSYSVCKRKDKKNIIIIILIFILSISFAYREVFYNQGMGNDYYAYKSWFENMGFYRVINNITNLSFQNILFDVLMSFVKIFTNDFHVFLFVCSLIYNYLIFAFIKRYCTYNFFIATMLYISFIYFMSFNVLRQCVACSIFLFGFRYINTKQLCKYLLCIVFSTLVHTSAIFLIVVYPFINWKASIYLKALISIGISVLVHFNFNRVLSLIFNLSTYLGLDYAQKYQAMPALDLGNYMPFIITFITVIVLLFIISYKKVTFTKDEMCITEYTIIAAALAFCAPLNIVFNRLLAYFFVSIVAAIPMIKKCFNKDSKLLFQGIVLFVSFYVFLF